MGYVYVVCRLIDALWDVAQARYVGAPLKQIDLFDGVPLDAIRKGDDLAFTSMTVDLR